MKPCPQCDGEGKVPETLKYGRTTRRKWEVAMKLCPQCDGEGKVPETLKEYLDANRGRTRPPFEPSAFYNPVGNFLDVYWSDRSTYSKELNKNITLHLDNETDEIVGVQVHGLLQVLGLK